MCSPAINTPGLTPTLTPKKEKNRSIRASKAMEEEPLPKSSRRQRMESMWMDQMGTYHQHVLTKVSMPTILFSSFVFCCETFVPSIGSDMNKFWVKNM
jgi:hypothetical protein